MDSIAMAKDALTIFIIFACATVWCVIVYGARKGWW